MKRRMNLRTEIEKRTPDDRSQNVQFGREGLPEQGVKEGVA